MVLYNIYADTSQYVYQISSPASCLMLPGISTQTCHGDDGSIRGDPALQVRALQVESLPSCVRRSNNHNDLVWPYWFIDRESSDLYVDSSLSILIVLLHSIVLILLKEASAISFRLMLYPAGRKCKTQWSRFRQHRPLKLFGPIIMFLMRGIILNVKTSFLIASLMQHQVSRYTPWSWSCKLTMWAFLVPPFTVMKSM